MLVVGIKLSKLIILARYWNETEYLKASLDYVEYWGADKVILSEGCWDRTKIAQSTDGTRELLVEFAGRRSGSGVMLINNMRENEDCRINQANTSNLAMELAGCEVGDWMLCVDADWFYFKRDIDFIKEVIAEEGDKFDYFVCGVRCFLNGLDQFNFLEERNHGLLPVKIKLGCKWIRMNHPSIRGVKYDRVISGVNSYSLSDVYGFHYEGMHSSDRLKSQHLIGDVRLRNLRGYTGPHPEFVQEVLKGYGQ